MEENKKIIAAKNKKIGIKVKWLITLLVVISALTGCYIIMTYNSYESLTEKHERKEVNLPSGVNENLKEPLRLFLTEWCKESGQRLTINANLSTKNLNGYYAYAVTATHKDKVVTLSAKQGSIEVPENRITIHKGFTVDTEPLSSSPASLAIVHVVGAVVINAELYQLDSSITELEGSIAEVELTNTSSPPKSKEPSPVKNYSKLTADDWRGMTLLTVREIKSKNMGAVVIVPTKNVKASEDLRGTFYYIIGGIIKYGDSTHTVLEVKNHKEISLDFPIGNVSQYVGKVSWLHILTHDGVIQNIEVETFDGADTNTMLDGMLSYIGVAS